MRVLVTGATGFLGRHLVECLLAGGHEVQCLLRPSSDQARIPAGVRAWPVDESPEAFDRAFAQFRPDAVIHLAALYVAEHGPHDVLPLVQANIAYGALLLDAMARHGCDAVVWAGSAWQHFRHRAYCPLNLYAATKQAFSTIAEYFLDAAGLKLVELHLYDSYGEDDPRGKLIGQLKRAAETSVDLPMSDGHQRLHLVHVDDLARGFVHAAAVARGLPAGTRRVYRLPSARPVSLRELVAAFNAADPTRPVRVRWGERPSRAREAAEPWEDAPALPGWQPEVSLETGLARVRSAAGEGER